MAQFGNTFYLSWEILFGQKMQKVHFQVCRINPNKQRAKFQMMRTKYQIITWYVGIWYESSSLSSYFLLIDDLIDAITFLAHLWLVNQSVKAKVNLSGCSTFPHCASSNVSSNCLHERMHNHTGCTCLTFLQCASSNVSSNGLH